MTFSQKKLAIFLAIFLGVVPMAHATSSRPTDVAELTRTSDEVIIGTVRRSHSLWDEGFIVTDHELEVLAAIKGRAPIRSTMVVRVAGGVVGRIGQTIPGAPTLQDGRTYVLFLAGGVSNIRYLAHMTAAVVPVTADAQGRVQATLPETLYVGSTVAGISARSTTMMVPLNQVTSVVQAVRP
jgi:hypothetical protein